MTVVRAVLVVLAFVLMGGAFAQEERSVGAFWVVQDRDSDADINLSYMYTFPAVEPEDEASAGLALGWSCLEDGLNVVVYFGKYLAGDDDGTVEVRYAFDGGANDDDARWDLFGSHEAAWLQLNHVPRFTAAARASSEVALEVIDPFDGETLRATFSLEGFGRALRDVLPCDRVVP